MTSSNSLAANIMKLITNTRTLFTEFFKGQIIWSKIMYYFTYVDKILNAYNYKPDCSCHVSNDGPFNGDYLTDNIVYKASTS